MHTPPFLALFVHPPLLHSLLCVSYILRNSLEIIPSINASTQSYAPPAVMDPTPISVKFPNGVEASHAR